MKIYTKISAILLAATVALTSAVSCTEDGPADNSEKVLGSFTYEGETYSIRSVVVYKMNEVYQIWISETAGYTTVDEIEASAGELVLNIPRGKVGQGNVFFEQTGDFIKYDGMENKGFCTVECTIDDDSKHISFTFSSQYMKSVSNAIEGSYSGPYSEYKEKNLEQNQWAYNRSVKSLTKAECYTMEDGAANRFVLYDNKAAAVEVDITPAKVGTTVTVGTNAENHISRVAFNNGETFKLDGTYGTVTTAISGTELTLSLKLTNSAGKVLRAEYKGEFKSRLGNKRDRCRIFSKNGTNQKGTVYDGEFYISGVTTEPNGTNTIFRFQPGANISAELVGSESSLVPTLSIPASLINKGNVYLKNTAGWTMTYASGMAFPPRSSSSLFEISDDSYLNVSEKNGEYVIDMEIFYSYTLLESVLVLDENGNEILVNGPQKTDALGNPMYDDDDNPIYEQVPMRENKDIPYVSHLDLYYSTSTDNAATN